ncbi:F0F1 ATP synthase subunit gamma [Candidatus Saganbacteria bacterium]|nr:F0F1 ATP synthase subunit gamma [Candidatus Saganbacteria bacterium]
MSDVLALKNRHKTIKSLDSVMSAIMLITAAKLHKAKIHHLHTASYAEAVKEMAEAVISGSETDKKSNEVLVIAIGTNKGFCGNFNDKIVNSLLSFKAQTTKNISLFILGKNLRKLSRKGFDVFSEDFDVIKNSSFENLAAAAKIILKWHEEKKGEVHIAYNEFVSILSQKPKIIKILPFRGSGEPSDQYVVEPSRDEIKDSLLNHYLISILCKCIVESELGELNARMVIVKGATDSAKDLISELSIRINKARQAMITSELTEITSSFESLKGGEE